MNFKVIIAVVVAVFAVFVGAQETGQGATTEAANSTTTTEASA